MVSACYDPPLDAHPTGPCSSTIRFAPGEFRRELQMPVSPLTKIDAIDELMYRCWARRNYVPSELREADWHPVILEEMGLRDEELAEEARALERLNAMPTPPYVPLVPMVTHLVHPEHAQVREPHFLSAGDTAGTYYTDSIYAGGMFAFDL